jgi:hAT family C-terminal dimerisation region
VNELRVRLVCQTCAPCCSVCLCVSVCVSVATFYKRCAVRVMRWMRAKATAEAALDSEGGEDSDGVESRPAKRMRSSFLGSMREFAAEESSRDVHPSAATGGAQVFNDEWAAYKAYKVQAASSEETPLNWWGVHEQMFPAVALAAKYLLSFPATSVASEHVFSKAGRTMTKRRARMTGRTAEKYVVLNDSMSRVRRLKAASDPRHVE